MKLGIRLLLGFFLVAGLAAFFVLRVFVAEIKPSVREVMEDVLVDTANLLAEQVADELAALPAGGSLDDHSRFARSVRSYAARPIDARIWGLDKRSLDLRVYVTDAAGRVVFDAGAGVVSAAVGADYSRWRDVARTLRGEYGARATREIQTDERTSVMFVAAPVTAEGRVIGVLTVGKPFATVQPFIERVERKILRAGLWLFGLSLAIGVLVSAWLIWSIRRLRRYAQAVGAGPRVELPTLSGELGELAQAMDGMRTRLEGRERLEGTVRALTHELKSPLAAIRASAELLRDALPERDRTEFATQIEDQAERLRVLVERLLELSKLEGRPPIAPEARARLSACVAQAWATLQARARQRDTTLQWTTTGADAAAEVHGDSELITLAIANLLGNALDFGPPGAVIEVGIRRDTQSTTLEVRDHGPGVPDYAREHLGQRFYSTPRPAGAGGPAGKGSGLGLAIVQQVMLLHGGAWSAEAAAPGWRVRLHFRDG